MLPLTNPYLGSKFLLPRTGGEQDIANFGTLITPALNDLLSEINSGQHPSSSNSHAELTNYLHGSKLLLDEFIKAAQINSTSLLVAELNGLPIKLIQEEQDGKPVLQLSYNNKVEIIENMTVDLWACKFIQELRRPENADLLDSLEIDMSSVPDSGEHSLKVMVSFNEVDFTKVNYDFSKHVAQMRCASFERANLTERNFSSQSFLMVNFKDATIDGAHFLKTNLAFSSFVNASLVEATLSELSLKETKFTGANCKGTSFDSVNIIGADFTDAIFNGDENFKLNLPTEWNSSNLDTVLNHLSNTATGSVLTAINSIDDKYSVMKCKLMNQVIDSVNDADISTVTGAFFDIFKTPIYLHDTTINSFIKERLLPNVISEAMTSSLKVDNDSVLLMLLETVAEQGDNKAQFMLEKNGFFVQLLAACSGHENADIKEAGVQLYHEYMNLGELKGYKKTDTFIGDLDENSEANVEKNLEEIRDIHIDDPAFVFFSKDDQHNTHALIVSKNMMSSMLRQDPDYAWDRLHYIKNEQRTVLKDIAQAYQPFPLFYDNYQALEQRASFSKLLLTINLNFSNPDNNENTVARDYTALFEDALHLKSSDEKLTGPADQIALAEIFSPLLDAEKGLSDAHYQEIGEIYQLDEMDDAAKAKMFFCLAAVFVTYSSSFFFGQEGESPNALRNYAVGLMVKAHSLDPTVFVDVDGNDQYGDYLNRLKGQQAAFTCTGLLKDIMKLHAQDLGFNNLMMQMKPPAW